MDRKRLGAAIILGMCMTAFLGCATTAQKQEVLKELHRDLEEKRVKEEVEREKHWTRWMQVQRELYDQREGELKETLESAVQTVLELESLTAEGEVLKARVEVFEGRMTKSELDLEELRGFNERAKVELDEDQKRGIERLIQVELETRREQEKKMEDLDDLVTGLQLQEWRKFSNSFKKSVEVVDGLGRRLKEMEKKFASVSTKPKGELVEKPWRKEIPWWAVSQMIVSVALAICILVMFFWLKRNEQTLARAARKP